MEIKYEEVPAHLLEQGDLIVEVSGDEVDPEPWICEKVIGNYSDPEVPRERMLVVRGAVHGGGWGAHRIVFVRSYQAVKRQLAVAA